MSEELKPESQFTEQERQLYDLMSEISEDCWCAGWIGGNEFSLWNAITTGDLTYGQGEIDRLMLAKVAALSVETGKWIIWRDDADGLDRHDTSEWGPYVISLAEWSRRRAASTIPASEAGELPPLPSVIGGIVDPYPEQSIRISVADLCDMLKNYARAALASTRTASDTRTAAGEVDVEAERPRFEAFARSEACPMLRDGEGYKNARTQTFWTVWLAARTQADAGKDAARWRAFRARDELENLDFTAFQDQFREDADKIIDDAMLSASAAHSAEGE